MLDEASRVPSVDAPVDGSGECEAVDGVTDGSVRGGIAGALARFAPIALLPLALYLVLRPENYSLTPNSLDPVFYTGYSMNFDDVMNAVRDRHYFITRWSVYLPMRVFDAMFGPIAGRLIWRWVLAVFVGAVLAAFARERGCRRSVQLLLVALALSMPMFVRAFMSDYMEFAVLSLGLMIVVVCLRERHGARSGALVGGLGALMLVANPVSVFMLTFSIVVALVLCRNGWRARARFVAGGGVAAVVVFAAGLIFFRWRYGIENVYQPSIDFMRTYQGDPDAWKSPRLDWMGRFTWIYAPLVLLAVAGLMSLTRRVRWTRVEIGSFALLGVQYCYHWFDQFVQNNFGLELSFYWSFIYPTFAIALIVVVGKLAEHTRDVWLAAAGIGWIGFLAVGVPTALRLPPGLWFGFVLLAVIGTCVALGRVSLPAVAALMVALIGWSQIGAPSYDPSAYFRLNVSPEYDDLFRRGGDESEQILDETVWFADQMDRVPNDASTSFVTVGGWSSSIVGIYAPHVTGRWITTNDPDGHLRIETLREIKGGNRPILAVFGPPASVQPVVDNLVVDAGATVQVLDETHEGALGYRLVVYLLPDSARLPFTWSADSLRVASGEPTAEGSVVVSEPTPAGFVTYGPYRSLPAGSYSATLTYSSSVDGSADAGAFDVSALGGATAAVQQLSGTAGRPASVVVPFSVTDPAALWEFRTSWLGEGDFTVMSVEIDALASP